MSEAPSDRRPQAVLPGAQRLACLCLLLLAGCASIGPNSVARDRFDYISAISESWKRQTLLNLVKIRYAEAPVLMDVTSVISSYTFGSDLSAFAQAGTAGSGNTYGGVGAAVQYADKPTITYSPLSGDKFARNLMTPLPLPGVLALVQERYPADLVLRVCVSSINGLQNDFGGPGAAQAGSPRFHELAQLLRESQSAGGPNFRTRPTKDGQTLAMYFGPAQESTAQRLHALLGIDPTAREASITFGSTPAPDADIAVLTRSVLQVMIDLAAQIDVPPADVAEGRVYQPRRTPEQERLFPPLLAVRNGAAPPEDAHVAVSYRGRWFWIDDRDQRSKRTLAFLMMIYTLTETAPSTAGVPVVTVPAR